MAAELIAGEGVIRLRTDLSQVEAEMRGRVPQAVEKGLDGVEKKAAKALDFSKPTKKASRDLGKLGKDAARAGQTVAQGAMAGRASLLALTAAAGPAVAGVTALAAAGGQAVIAYANFEQELANVSTLVDTQVTDMRALGRGILEIDSALGPVTTNVQAMYQALSSGVEVSQAVALVGDAALFAKAALTDTFTAVEGGTLLMENFGVSSEVAFRAMQATVAEGRVTGSTLVPALGRVSAQSAATGQSLQDLTGNLAFVSTQVGNAALASTGLSAILAGLEKPAQASADALAEMSDGNISFADLRKQLGEEGLVGVMRTLIEVTGGAPEKLALLFESREARLGLAAYIKDIERASDAVEEHKRKFEDVNIVQDAAAKVTDTLRSQWDGLREDVGKVFIALGETPSGPLLDYVKEVREVVDGVLAVLNRAEEEKGLEGLLRRVADVMADLNEVPILGDSIPDDLVKGLEKAVGALDKVREKSKGLKDAEEAIDGVAGAAGGAGNTVPDAVEKITASFRKLQAQSLRLDIAEAIDARDLDGIKTLFSELEEVSVAALEKGEKSAAEFGLEIENTRRIIRGEAIDAVEDLADVIDREYVEAVERAQEAQAEWMDAVDEMVGDIDGLQDQLRDFQIEDAIAADDVELALSLVRDGLADTRQEIASKWIPLFKVDMHLAMVGFTADMAVAEREAADRMESIREQFDDTAATAEAMGRSLGGIGRAIGSSVAELSFGLAEAEDILNRLSGSLGSGVSDIFGTALTGIDGESGILFEAGGLFEGLGGSLAGSLIGGLAGGLVGAAASGVVTLAFDGFEQIVSGEVTELGEGLMKATAALPKITTGLGVGSSTVGHLTGATTAGLGFLAGFVLEALGIGEPSAEAKQAGRIQQRIAKVIKDADLATAIDKALQESMGVGATRTTFEHILAAPKSMPFLRQQARDLGILAGGEINAGIAEGLLSVDFQRALADGGHETGGLHPDDIATLLFSDGDRAYGEAIGVRFEAIAAQALAQSGKFGREAVEAAFDLAAGLQQEAFLRVLEGEDLEAYIASFEESLGLTESFSGTLEDFNDALRGEGALDGFIDGFGQMLAPLSKAEEGFLRSRDNLLELATAAGLTDDEFTAMLDRFLEANPQFQAMADTLEVDLIEALNGTADAAARVAEGFGTAAESIAAVMENFSTFSLNEQGELRVDNLTERIEEAQRKLAETDDDGNLVITGQARVDLELKLDGMQDQLRQAESDLRTFNSTLQATFDEQFQLISADGIDEAEAAQFVAQVQAALEQGGDAITDGTLDLAASYFSRLREQFGMTEDEILAQFLNAGGSIDELVYGGLEQTAPDVNAAIGESADGAGTLAEHLGLSAEEAAKLNDTLGPMSAGVAELAGSTASLGATIAGDNGLTALLAEFGRVALDESDRASTALDGTTLSSEGLHAVLGDIITAEGDVGDEGEIAMRLLDSGMLEAIGSAALLNDEYAEMVRHLREIHGFEDPPDPGDPKKEDKDDDKNSFTLSTFGTSRLAASSFNLADISLDQRIPSQLLGGREAAAIGSFASRRAAPVESRRVDAGSAQPGSTPTASVDYELVAIHREDLARALTPDVLLEARQLTRRGRAGIDAGGGIWVSASERR